MLIHLIGEFMSSFQDWSTPPEYSILFREATPPGPELLEPLCPKEIDHRDDGTWVAKIESVKGCYIWVVSDPKPRESLAIDLRFSPGLTEDEEAKISQCQSQWHVMLDPGPGPVLQTRKQTLVALGKIFRTIRKGLGFFCVDSLRVWSLAMLTDELQTKAGLDIDALYGIHPVVNHDGSRWVHTHGLAALGGFDIDLINPSDEVLGIAHTLIRSLAFAIVEGSLVIDEPAFQIAQPGGMIRMVPAREFDAQVDPKFKGIREPDEFHVENRAVVCEPKLKKSMLGLGKPKLEPSRFVRGGISEHTVFGLSKTATDLIAQRSQETFPLLVQLMEEFQSLELPVLAKVACRVDSGEADEHIWFDVHNADVNGIDATCLNQPYEVSGLKEGDRGRYGFGQITEWQMQTPIGSISPNQFGPIRHIRANRAELEEIMRQHRAENPG